MLAYAPHRQTKVLQEAEGTCARRSDAQYWAMSLEAPDRQKRRGHATSATPDEIKQDLDRERLYSTSTRKDARYWSGPADPPPVVLQRGDLQCAEEH